MAGNTFGKLLKLTTFGESHGEALGGIIDGCPAGIALDFEFIQNEMQPTLNSFLATLQVLIEDKNLILKGTYEHMPIMQFILIERFDGIMKRGQALSALRAAGLPDDVALEECGYDKNIVLTEVKMQENGNSNGTSEEEGENGEEGESDENEQNED